MTNLTLAKGSNETADLNVIYTADSTRSDSVSLLPILFVNRSSAEIYIRVYWDDSGTIGGGEVVIPAGDGKWRHMVGMPLGITFGESISIQCETADRFDYHLSGSVF